MAVEAVEFAARLYGQGNTVTTKWVPGHKESQAMESLTRQTKICGRSKAAVLRVGFAFLRRQATERARSGESGSTK